METDLDISLTDNDVLHDRLNDVALLLLTQRVPTAIEVTRALNHLFAG